MAVNIPIGDHARKGAVKKRTQLNEAGRSERLDQAQQDIRKFMAVKKAATTKEAAKKFKGLRREKRALRYPSKSPRRSALGV